MGLCPWNMTSRAAVEISGRSVHSELHRNAPKQLGQIAILASENIPCKSSKSWDHQLILKQPWWLGDRPFKETSIPCHQTNTIGLICFGTSSGSVPAPVPAVIAHWNENRLWSTVRLTLVQQNHGTCKICMRYCEIAWVQLIWLPNYIAIYMVFTLR